MPRNRRDGIASVWPASQCPRQSLIRDESFAPLNIAFLNIKGVSTPFLAQLLRLQFQSFLASLDLFLLKMRVGSELFGLLAHFPLFPAEFLAKFPDRGARVLRGKFHLRLQPREFLL